MPSSFNRSIAIANWIYRTIDDHIRNHGAYYDKNMGNGYGKTRQDEMSGSI